MPALLPNSRPVHEFVNVDVFVPGCPPSADTIYYVVPELLEGRQPDVSASTRFGSVSFEEFKGDFVKQGSSSSSIRLRALKATPKSRSIWMKMAGWRKRAFTLRNFAASRSCAKGARFTRCRP